MRGVAEAAREPIDGGLNAGQRQPGGAEETEHPGPAHGLDHFDGADAVGHGAGDVGVAEPVVGAERGVAEVFEAAGGDEGGTGPLSHHPAAALLIEDKRTDDGANRFVEIRIVGHARRRLRD